MKRITVILALTMLAALAASPVMATGVPSTINLQGRFTDAAGNKVADGVYPAVFSIYDDQIAGTLLWSDTLPVQVSGGLFTVLIGTDTPIPANIFSRFANLYLGITVTPEPELPRVPLSSVAYAFQGQYAEDAVLAHDLTCLGCVTGGVGGDIAPNSITNDELGTNSVGADEIKAGAVIGGLGGDIDDGTLTHDDLGTGSVNANEIGIGAVNSSGVLDNSLLAADIAAGAVVGGLGGDIADGTLTHDDLGTGSVNANEISIGAVNTSGVLDNSLLAVDIQDEPGVAGIGDDAGLNMNGSLQFLLSRSIIGPAAGYVLVIASAEVVITHSNGTNSSATFGVSTSSGAFAANQSVGLTISSGLPSGTYGLAVTVHGLFATIGGSDVFYFLGEETSGSFSVFDRELTVVYFPTAHGAVVSTAAASGGEELSSQSGESGSLVPVVASEPSQTQVNADMEARVRRLEELLHQTQPRTDEQR